MSMSTEVDCQGYFLIGISSEIGGSISEHNIRRTVMKF